VVQKDEKIISCLINKKRCPKLNTPFENIIILIRLAYQANSMVCDKCA
jgi:hypothetical protein